MQKSRWSLFGYLMPLHKTPAEIFPQAFLVGCHEDLYRPGFLRTFSLSSGSEVCFVENSQQKPCFYTKDKRSLTDAQLVEAAEAYVSHRGLRVFQSDFYHACVLRGEVVVEYVILTALPTGRCVDLREETKTMPCFLSWFANIG